MKQELKKEIAPQATGGFLLPDGYSYDIIAASESHKRRVKMVCKGRVPTGEFFYQVKNNNDSEIWIKIFKLKDVEI